MCFTNKHPLWLHSHGTLFNGFISIEPPCAPVSEGNTLERYLRSFYCKSAQLGGSTEWPPTVKVEYINLELVSHEKMSTFQHQEKIAELSRLGEIGAAVKQSSKLAFEDITNYSSPRKVILVEGAPGIGKTTFAYKLCQDWANGKLPEFWLALYVPLRVPLMRVAERSDDLLQYFGEHCSAADVHIIKQTQGKGVLFVLDGWDELRPSCRLPNSFFPRLIRGEFFPESSVIITSRPGAVSPFMRTNYADRLVEILGFTEDQIRQYIHCYFKKHEGAAQRLAEDLLAFPNVASTCYVAINLTIVCYVYWASGFLLPNTLTEVYVQFVIHAIKRHLKRISETTIDDSSKINVESLDSIQAVSDFSDTVTVVFNGLCKLALDGLQRGDLSFSRADITNACHVAEEFDGFGLLKILPVYRKHGTENTYHFLHLTVQECLAAYTVCQMKEHEQSTWLERNFTNETYERVLRFFCGLDQFKSHPARGIFSKYITKPLALECVYEGQWEDACQTFAEQTGGNLVITSRSHTEPYQGLVYGYLLTKSRTQWHLLWKEVVLGEHELKRMGQHLLDSPTALTQISLTQSSFTSHEAAELFSKLIHSQKHLAGLTLSRMNLDKDCLNSICQALVGHCKLTAIKLTHSVVPENAHEAVISLLTSVPSLCVLDLSSTNFGEDSCRAILQAAYTSAPLQVLHLPHKSDTLSKECDKLKARRKDIGLNELAIHLP